MSTPNKRKILLILPCATTSILGDFRLSRTWRYIMKNVTPYKKYITLAAVECIPDENNEPFGILVEGEFHKTKGKSMYPGWVGYSKQPERLEKLKRKVLEKLQNLRKEYDYLIAYVNVKAYRMALEYAKENGVDIDIINLKFNRGSFNKKANVNKLLSKIRERIGCDDLRKWL